MRLRSLALAVLVATSVGCTGWAFVLNPPSGRLIDLAMWTDVPETQDNVKAKVGDVLHLPLGPKSPGGPTACTVTVNGTSPERPEYSVSLKTVSYIFRAEQAGEFRVEGMNPLDLHRESRVWVITVAE